MGGGGGDNRPWMTQSVYKALMQQTDDLLKKYEEAVAARNEKVAEAFGNKAQEEFDERYEQDKQTQRSTANKAADVIEKNNLEGKIKWTGPKDDSNIKNTTITGLDEEDDDKKVLQEDGTIGLTAGNSGWSGNMFGSSVSKGKSYVDDQYDLNNAWKEAFAKETDADRSNDEFDVSYDDQDSYSTARNGLLQFIGAHRIDNDDDFNNNYGESPDDNREVGVD